MTIDQSLVKACNELKLPLPEVISRDGLRITLSEPSESFHKHALKIEARMQSMTGKPIDLRFEGLADKNKRAGRNGRE